MTTTPSSHNQKQQSMTTDYAILSTFLLSLSLSLLQNHFNELADHFSLIQFYRKRNDLFCFYPFFRDKNWLMLTRKDKQSVEKYFHFSSCCFFFVPFGVHTFCCSRCYHRIDCTVSFIFQHCSIACLCRVRSFIVEFWFRVCFQQPDFQHFRVSLKSCEMCDACDSFFF